MSLVKPSLFSSDNHSSRVCVRQGKTRSEHTQETIDYNKFQICAGASRVCACAGVAALIFDEHSSASFTIALFSCCSFPVSLRLPLSLLLPRPVRRRKCHVLAILTVALVRRIFFLFLAFFLSLFLSLPCSSRPVSGAFAFAFAFRT